ncbi:MAG: D-Ala-D-Ala carboxypeptidase family metallohydrolase [Aminivibrio sp.]|jgi:hypothetical protein
MMRIYPVYFSSQEFACKCGCEKNAIAAALVLRLDALREICGPIRVTSGRRCPAHNAAVGGVHNSRHLSGLAADIVPVKVSLDFLTALAGCFFHPKGKGGHDELIRYRTFLHVAVSPHYGIEWTGGPLEI